ncbi:hypothetical protein [Arthrobacter sp. H35-D1]|uniref:hypothetical protein n=1 Tax=Arthrobacter sp. H35-D1 TaxID=3046202 RepID=UPI0024BBB3CD|nr:hypothetical protein [Arthrobacter sp. H35-D1]MDJ0312339.1 hypothetical protein [Arthrobacter sp. H35-D1]
MGNRRSGMAGARPAACDGSSVPGLAVWLPGVADGSAWTDDGTGLDVAEGESGLDAGVEHPVSAMDETSARTRDVHAMGDRFSELFMFFPVL